ncbi:MAG: hypothetical protein HYT97_09875, partial [Elusimicrobia bacterium]|nr:hypothetical protein [Elusimicrobiota bacterium]
MIEYTQRQKNQFFKKSAAILVAGALLCSMILPPYAFTYQRGYLSFVEKKSAENHNMRERSNLIGNSREASRVLLKDSIPHGGAEVISDAMEELFVAPYREFLDTFNPVQFFKSHREQTLGQAIGIVMIWGAMVATMIGAPFGIDFLLSGSPTNHLGFTLISSFIGSLSIVAGIRLNHLKENEDQLNQLKKTSGSHSELKQQRSALNVVVQELIHFDQLIQTGYKPNRTEKLILSIAYFTYPVNVLTHHLFNLISNLTRPLGKWRLAPLTKVRVGEDPYQWATREQGIQNVIDGIRRNRPDIIKRYENLKHLKDEEKTYEQQLLEIEFYRISKGHFSIWGLESATRFRRAPYFNGSYIDALILAFPSLNLIPQGFKLYWSTPEEGIESIKYIFSKEIPDIMQKYEGFEKLSEKEVEWVKEKVYKITSGHFYAWGLSSAIHIEKTPYFNGNYIDVLIAVFPKLNLDPLGFKLDWTTKQMGIDSVKYVLSRKIPEIMRQYDRINELTPREIQSLRNSIYRITQGMFKSWGLSAATNSASTPYFNGSYMNPLIFVFDDPRLALSIKGFKDYRKSTRQEIYSWRTYESGIWSVTEAIRSHMPYLLESYENRRNLSKDAIEQLKEEIYKLTSNDFQAWGLNAALSIHRAPYFHGSHINALSIIFTDLNLNPLGFHLDWSNQEKGIESIHFVLSKVRPHLLEAYKNRNSIHSKKVELAKKEIYKISHGHFMMWRLGGATNRKIAPYFKGSFIEALMALFPEFHLNPLEFRLDWSTPKKGIESVRFTLYKESPYIMKQYEMIEELPDKEIQKLRDKIYEIDSGFFKVWGLSAVTSVGQTPYFHGSYIAALLAVFSHPKLGLTREGFAERTGNAGSAATQMAETTGDEDSDSSVMTESP